MTRKRKRADLVSSQPRKLLKPNAAEDATDAPSALLALYYPKVLFLKDFFLARLPAKSRVRRRRIESLAAGQPHSLLNTALVGVLTEPDPAIQRVRTSELLAFTQSQRISAESGSANAPTCSIKEIVNFALWTLVRNRSSSFGKPRHLLCNGIQRATANPSNHSHGQVHHLPGFVQQHPNENLKALKCPPWSEFLGLLGADGEAILASLFLDCGIFTLLANGHRNYFQLCGIPISDLKPQHTSLRAQNGGPSAGVARKPTDIRFIRNRILYARSSLNGKGQVHFGLKHVHVLQRYHQTQDELESVHIMKHIFPRQFGLHNVFTSPIDPSETTQPLPDYTYREDEISKDRRHPRHWLPKRLRGGPMQLIRRLRKSHSRCAYSQLLLHYCPIPCTRNYLRPSKPQGFEAAHMNSGQLMTQSRTSSALVEISTDMVNDGENACSFLPYTTPVADVSAFCNSVISRLLPRNSLGIAADDQHNWLVLKRNIGKFVAARRFETLSLQQVVQNMKIKSISWLANGNEQNRPNLSKNEAIKRTELLHEFLYYVFDSLLIPLIRTNFYVTESGPSRNKLLYFRHDVWRRLSTPSLALLRLNLYQPLKSHDLRRTLSGRSLGYGHVRLLPKAEGIRTITNLKRRIIKSVNGRRTFSPSINAQLGPVFGVLNYQRLQKPELLGSALLSVSDLHQKLRNFKVGLPKGSKIYFLKVDVQSCFDTIPQDQLIGLVEKIIESPWYSTTKYAEIKLADKGNSRRQKFVNSCRPSSVGAAFCEAVAEQVVKTKQGTVLVEAGKARDWQQRQLLKLLQDHIQHNVVKIGKKHLQQKRGIPQGSILSSLLCSYFYTAFEAEHLSFLSAGSSLLLRLIDDFLLVTTKKAEARKFAETMMRSNSTYGIATNAEKSLANFDVQVGVDRIPQHHGRHGFPYCGMRIDVRSLELSKDRAVNNAAISNGLTVDANKSAGTVFHRKMLLAFRIQMQTMLVDPTLNGRERVMTTLMETFSETTMKMLRYLKSMRPEHGDGTRLMISVMVDLVQLASRYLKSRCEADIGKECWNGITRKQVCWIASASMERVLLRKQSRYQEVLAWLRSLKEDTEASLGMDAKTLNRLLENCNKALQHYAY